MTTVLLKSLLCRWIKGVHTFAIHRKADQGEGNTYITQDVVRAIEVSPGHSCAMSFTIEAMVKLIYVCTNTLDGCYGCFD